MSEQICISCGGEAYALHTFPHSYCLSSFVPRPPPTKSLGTSLELPWDRHVLSEIKSIYLYIYIYIYNIIYYSLRLGETEVTHIWLT